MTLELLQPPRSSGTELAATSQAAMAKATIEAKFTVAMARPRSELTSRQKMLDACKRFPFAEGARYCIKRGKKPNGEPNYIEGFTIRFAECALQAWGNVFTSASVLFDDESKRVIRVDMLDLESNTSYGDEIILEKTVERTYLRDGQTAISERKNSENKTVFLVFATEDDLLMKLNAAKSRVIRTAGLRLIPEDIQEEAWNQCIKTMQEGDKDPMVAIKNIAEQFHQIGVSAKDIEAFLGRALAGVSPTEIARLRKIWSGIKNGHTTWAEVIAPDPDADPDDNKVPMDFKQEPEKAKRSRKAAASPSNPANTPTQQATPATTTTQDPPKSSNPPAQQQEFPAGTILENDGKTPTHAMISSVCARHGVSFDAFKNFFIGRGTLIVPQSGCHKFEELPPTFLQTFRDKEAIVDRAVSTIPKS